MKSTPTLLLIVLLFLSCQSNPRNSQPTSTDHKQLLAQYFDAFNSHRWNDLALFYAPSVEVRTASQGIEPVQVSNIDLTHVYQDLERAFPDISDSIVNIFVDEGTAIIELVSKGISPIGDTLYLPICQILEFDKNGKITRDYSYYDD